MPFGGREEELSNQPPGVNPNTVARVECNLDSTSRASGMAVTLDDYADLANPVWTSPQTNGLTADTLDFRDPQWTNFPARFCRVRCS